jgi:hypothetical protein
MLTLAEARERHARGIRVSVRRRVPDQDNQIVSLLRACFVGRDIENALPIFLEVSSQEQFCRLALGPNFYLKPSDENLRCLVNIDFVASVELEYR